jgi:hypothetical protein
MTFSMRKRAFVAMAGLLFFSLALMWVAAPPAPVRLSFLYTTNIDQEVRGVFLVANTLKERVTFWSGFYQRAGERGFERSESDHFADLGGPRHFSPGVTNTLEVWIPLMVAPTEWFCAIESTVSPVPNHSGSAS